MVILIIYKIIVLQNVTYKTGMEVFHKINIFGAIKE